MIVIIIIIIIIVITTTIDRQISPQAPGGARRGRRARGVPFLGREWAVNSYDSY